jgi:hypothetical protein
MLKVTIYDKLESPSTDGPRLVGHHDLIAIYGGEVDWNQELSAEMKQQIGALLVTGNFFLLLTVISLY